jgi:hypothetical protein
VSRHRSEYSGKTCLGGAAVPAGRRRCSRCLMMSMVVIVVRNPEAQSSSRLGWHRGTEAVIGHAAPPCPTRWLRLARDETPRAPRRGCLRHRPTRVRHAGSVDAEIAFSAWQSWEKSSEFLSVSKDLRATSISTTNRAVASLPEPWTCANFDTTFSEFWRFSDLFFGPPDATFAEISVLFASRCTLL